MESTPKSARKAKKDPSPQKTLKKNESHSKFSEPVVESKSARGIKKNQKSVDKHESPKRNKSAAGGSKNRKNEKQKSVEKSAEKKSDKSKKSLSPAKFSSKVKKQKRNDTEMRDQAGDHPKKPLSSYMLFCQENRKQLTDQNPEKKVTEIAVMLGNLWKNMESAEKIFYQEKYNENKVLFNKEMENFKKSNFTEPKEEKLKRPMNAFMHFSKQNDEKYRKQYPDLKQSEISHQKGKDWSAMDATQRQAYEQLAEKEKQDYHLLIQTQQLQLQTQEEEKVQEKKKEKKRESPEKKSVERPVKPQKSNKTMTQGSESTNTSRGKSKGK